MPASYLVTATYRKRGVVVRQGTWPALRQPSVSIQQHRGAWRALLSLGYKPVKNAAGTGCGAQRRSP